MLSPLLSALFLLLTCAPLPLSCASSAVSGRRILHEPFFPSQDSAVPPSDPPEPKYPFSSSVSTPDPSPFFQTYPSPPPPPPPVAFASFPANISSLQLPDAPSSASSPSNLAFAVSAALFSAFVVAGISLFCFCRRRRIREVSDEKAAAAPVSGEAVAASRAQKLSSEILYLGTLVSSRPTGDDVGGDNGDGDVSGHQKVESPELRPLPPLSRRSDRSFGSTAGEEEFYSPEVSLGGGGSAAVESFRSGSSSCSSSSSGSPGRSHSVSLSPPVSLSPRRSEPKSPEHVAAVARPPSPPQAAVKPLIWTAYVINEPYTSSASSSERGSSENRDGSPTKSDGYGKYLRSPTLSPAILSAPVDQAPSLRLWTARGHNGHSSTPSTTSSSPERNPETVTANQKHTTSPATRNPETVTANQKHTPSPATRNPETVTANQKHTPSPALSPATRSPDRNPDQPTRVTTAMIQNVPSPARNEPSSAAPPPPPPLPPQKLSSPPQNPPKPIIAQLSSQPPPLTPPSRPFMFQNPTKPPPTPIQTNQPMEKIEEETSKPKLKPLHWDKVRASSGRDMVWDHLGSNSFKLNEEMIESLFIVNTPQSKPKEATPRSTSPYQDNRVLDPKKSQNIAIALRALNVTVDEVCDALSEGNADALGAELLEILLKMAPNKEEERKLKDFKDDPSIKLGTAEKFLKAVLDVPFAFRRVDAMLYMANFEAEIGYLNKSFETLEAACEELRSDRMFLKLLEAVLKTGNRMNVGTNRGDAHAFKLDTLLKLVDVKGADGKTTLLHFVVQEIIRTEGARLSDKNQAPGLPTLSEDVKCRKLGLQVVSGLSSELANVKKSASMDSEVLASDVYKLSRGINNIEEILRLNENIPPGETRQRFSESMNRFKKTSEEEILRIQARESAALSLVKEITEYFHGNSAREEAHPFRIFMVVRDFLNVLERVCKEVGSAHKLLVPINPMMPQPVLVFPEKKQHSSSDDDEPES